MTQHYKNQNQKGHDREAKHLLALSVHRENIVTGEGTVPGNGRFISYGFW